MKIFFQSLRSWIVQCKISFALRFVYPQKKKYRKIRSIVPAGIDIGDQLVLEENISFSAQLQRIGSHTYIGKNTYIGHCSTIGKFCSISYDVKIGLISHPKNFVSTSPLFYSPRRGWNNKPVFNETANGLSEIGHDVLISANAMILAGVKVGHGAIVGAGTLVNKDVAPYAIVGGIPARVLGFRFSEETIKRLLESKWWDLPDEQLRKHINEMNDADAFLNALTAEKK